VNKEQYIESRMKHLSKCSCGGENTSPGRAQWVCGTCGKDNALEYIMVWKLVEDDYYRKFPQ
jgi:hypothetical protein